jgi:hypothetical protein
VGRSVLEALRLLEACQADAKHAVFCPIDWKPTNCTSDTISTLSNTLTESYEERLAKLQKEFGNVQVTDLDAKRTTEEKQEDGPSNDEIKSDDTSSTAVTPSSSAKPSRSHSSDPPISLGVPCERPPHSSPHHRQRNDCLPRHTTFPLAQSPAPCPHSRPKARSAPRHPPKSP